jgi:hypothetical protein
MEPFSGRLCPLPAPLHPSSIAVFLGRPAPTVWVFMSLYLFQPLHKAAPLMYLRYRQMKRAKTL